VVGKGSDAVVDPHMIDTAAQLAESLNRLRNRRGLSYEVMQGKAEKLSMRRTGRPPAPLTRSTIGEIVTGKRLPTKDKLLTFLAVCQIPDADLSAWVGAWERAKTADVRRPAAAIWVAAADPRRLGVHASIQVDGASGDVPTYVPRDFDPALRQALASADNGAFVLLLGGSSAGKTRSLHEGIRAKLGTRWLAVPDSADDVRSLLDSAARGMVVWLDDLQKYLSGDHGITPGVIRGLLDTGVVIAATMWPEDYAARTTPRVPGTVDHHARARELLDLASVIEVADDLSAAEHSRARERAADDPRLHAALAASADGGMTQVLAAGPQLLRWWQQAPSPYARAVITAAIDARRLGIEAPLTRAYLRDAAPGYLSRSERASAPQDWFEQATDYAVTLLHGATSTLEPVDADEMGSLAGYTVADYLFQHGRKARRTECPPETTWLALIEHTEAPGDLRRIGFGAQSRLRLRYAELCFRTCLGRGEHTVLVFLVALLVRQARNAEATALLQSYSADASDRAMLIRLLGEQGDTSALQRESDAGNWLARAWLVEALARRGDTEALQARADRGDLLAVGRLKDLHVSPGHLKELRNRAATGDQFAAGRLAAVEADHGLNSKTHAPKQAIDADAELDFSLPTVFTTTEMYRFVDIISRAADTTGAADFLDACDAALVDHADNLRAEFLAEHDVDRLREVADTGEWAANFQLAELAAETGELDLEASFQDNSFAALKLADRMVQDGNLDEAINFLSQLADDGDDFAEMHLHELLSTHLGF
jgi:hypothetical protein